MYIYIKKKFYNPYIKILALKRFNLLIIVSKVYLNIALKNAIIKNANYAFFNLMHLIIRVSQFKTDKSTKPIDCFNNSFTNNFFAVATGIFLTQYDFVSLPTHRQKGICKTGS